MKRIAIRRVNGVLVEHTVNGVSQLPVTGLGDKIARIATPIARALRMKCIDKATGQPKPETPCDKAKQRMNAGESVASVVAKRLKGQ